MVTLLPLTSPFSSLVYFYLFFTFSTNLQTGYSAMSKRPLIHHDQCPPPLFCRSLFLEKLWCQVLRRKLFEIPHRHHRKGIKKRLAPAKDLGSSGEQNSQHVSFCFRYCVWDTHMCTQNQPSYYIEFKKYESYSYICMCEVFWYQHLFWLADQFTMIYLHLYFVCLAQAEENLVYSVV